MTKKNEGKFPMGAAEFDTTMRGMFTAPQPYPKKGKGSRKKKVGKK